MLAHKHSTFQVEIMASFVILFDLAFRRENLQNQLKIGSNSTGKSASRDSNAVSNLSIGTKAIAVISRVNKAKSSLFLYWY